MISTLPHYLRLIISLTFLSYTHGTYDPACHKGGPAIESEALVRIAENSKYLLYGGQGWGMKTYDTAFQTCRDNDLEVAQVTSLTDLKALVPAMEGYAAYPEWNIKEFYIAGSDSEDEGIWKYKNGVNITFQNFYGWNPQDLSFNTRGTANQIILRRAQGTLSAEKYGWVMVDIEVNCAEDRDNVDQAYFCQFKKNSPCFKNSVEEKTNKEAKVGHVKLGETKMRKYYVGRHQKNWYEAKSYCKEKKMAMLDLKIPAKEAKGLYKLLREWLFDNALLAVANSFYLDGKNTDIFRGNNDIPWEWIDSRLLDEFRDPIFKDKTTGERKFGRCLSVGTLFTNTTTFSLARSLCSLPRWFACYSDKQKCPDCKTTTPSSGWNSKETTKPPDSEATTTLKPDSEESTPSNGWNSKEAAPFEQEFEEPTTPSSDSEETTTPSSGSEEITQPSDGANSDEATTEFDFYDESGLESDRKRSANSDFRSYRRIFT